MSALRPLRVLRRLRNEALDWQDALGKGDRPSLDRALRDAGKVLDDATESAAGARTRTIKESEQLLVDALRAHALNLEADGEFYFANRKVRLRETARQKAKRAKALADSIEKDGLYEAVWG